MKMVPTITRVISRDKVRKREIVFVGNTTRIHAFMARLVNLNISVLTVESMDTLLQIALKSNKREVTKVTKIKDQHHLPINHIRS